jgi:hypothetical protein
MIPRISGNHALRPFIKHKDFNTKGCPSEKTTPMEETSDNGKINKKENARL